MTAETKVRTDTADEDGVIDRTSLVLTLLFALAIVLVNLSIFMVLWSHARHRALAPRPQISIGQAEPAARSALETSPASYATRPDKGRTRPASSTGTRGEPREARVDESSLAAAAGAGLKATPLP